MSSFSNLTRAPTLVPQERQLMEAHLLLLQALHHQKEIKTIGSSTFQQEHDEMRNNYMDLIP